MSKKTVLILGNPLNHEGGVVEFNRGLIKTINELNSGFFLEPFTIGSRMYLFYYPRLKKLLYPLYFLFDLCRFFFKLCKKDVRIIQVNPSLIPVPLIRDGVVVFFAKFLFKKEVVVVIHGWKDEFYDKVIHASFLKYFVTGFFNSADTIFVLSDEFKNKLVDLDIAPEKIKITTTFFYKEDVIVSDLVTDNRAPVNLLFLGRVSELKGITELIQALREISNRFENFNCRIVGHGDKPGVIDHYNKMVEDFGISNRVHFLGRITGEEKFKIYSDSDIYVFPSYTEGCPTSVIEALASGNFIVSTGVGALSDIVDSTNGIKVKVKSVSDLIDALDWSIRNIDQVRLLRHSISEASFSKYEVNFVAVSFMEAYSNY